MLFATTGKHSDAGSMIPIANGWEGPRETPSPVGCNRSLYDYRPGEESAAICGLGSRGKLQGLPSRWNWLYFDGQGIPMSCARLPKKRLSQFIFLLKPGDSIAG